MGVRASSALSSGLLGAAAEILFVPALIAVVIGLTVSIVGIPLLGAIPFALVLGALAWTGGFAAVAACLGARLRGSSIADIVIARHRSVDRLRGDLRIHGCGAGDFSRAGLDDAVRLDDASGGNCYRVRGVDDRARRRLVGPIRQTEGDAADARAVGKLLSSPSTLGSTVCQRYSRSTN